MSTTPQSRYRELALLGVGGMGAVYRVLDVERGTEHALKILLSPSPALRERLVREERLQGLVRHPNVVAAEGLVALEGGAVGLLMEYVDGPSLARFLERHRPSIAQVDALGRAIARAVIAAHARGLVHRDLKPSNILLAICEDTLVPKVSDFGIARLLADEATRVTQTGAAMGTPHYMAPEQVTDAKRVDERADIFSLGAVFYELATGAPPFGSGSALAVLDRARLGDFRPPQALRPELPDRMARAITRALAPRPEDRWPDCASLLRAWCGGLPDPPAEGLWPTEAIEGARALIASDEDATGAGQTWLNTAYTIPPDPPTPGPPPTRRRLGPLAVAALIASAAGGLGLWTARSRPPPRPPAAPAFKRLTFNPLDAQIFDAALSPDGSALATAEADGLFLRTELPGPASPVALPPGQRAVGVVWCGQKILAATLVDPEDQPAAWWLGRGDGAWHRLLGGAEVLACARDGSGLLVRLDRELLLQPLPEGTPRPIEGAGDGVIGAAALSPAGDRVAFTHHANGISSLRWAAVAGGPSEVLRTDVVPQALAWDGRDRLLWLRPREDETDDLWASLMVQDGLDGAPRVLVDRIGPAAAALSVARDGRRFSFVTLDRRRNLFAYDIAADRLTQLTDDPARTFAASWLDDRRIAYSTSTSGSLDLYRRDLGEGTPAPLLSAGDDLYGLTVVPGSGDWLFNRERDGRTELVRRSPAGEESVLWRSDTEDYLARRTTRCAPGPLCLHGAIEDEHIAIYRIGPGGLEALRELPIEPLRPVGWDLSPDGRQLAWSSPGGLSTLDLDSGHTRTVPVRADIQELAWSPDGAALWATAMNADGERYAILRLDPRSGAASVVRGDVGWLSHLAVSPSGEALAWTRTTYDLVAWLGELDGE